MLSVYNAKRQLYASSTIYISGKSGVRVGINGSSEPTLTDFGDLYANFMYHGNGGSMEVTK